MTTHFSTLLTKTEHQTFKPFKTQISQSNNKKSKKMSLFLLLALLLLPFITPSSQSSIRNLLEARGLPGGLFPDNVESYSLDVKTGELEVQLQNPCFARFENRVYFDSVIKANLSYGGLVGLQGLTQEELFLWLPVKGIAVNDSSSGLVLFDIGVAHKQISRSLFEDPPVCYPPGSIMEKIEKRKMDIQLQR
ncbi:uncharacterized protein LOC103830973 [Brassica rapa]|nr:uncharacterized protein LOC103830973 [Brassica rapa]XP_013670230.2 uncharacterized protein BNAA01G36120D [Brassica napus]KAH0943030.1 hypothetical protein HID58_002667 [Brassica napus]CAF2153028.1 unnamed protein product [Brassica napus]CAG7889269.1 unnamed protein product [Brassica rapa]VDC76681.1 unnamed protein product [Brassica rapa]